MGVGVGVGVGTTTATCTTAVELLFAPTFWSACSAAIRAVLVIVPETVVLTTIANLAVGASYTFTGASNKSAVHWDLVKYLRPGGEL